MKIYLSSTYKDLLLPRQAVATVLRRMGHQPIGMEEYVAEGIRPLSRCLEDVKQCDAFIGILAWRYGYMPKELGDVSTTLPSGTKLGETSITEYEYRQAVASNKRPLMFLLDPQADWSANSFDAISGEETKGQRILSLRNEISQNYLVSFFRNADDLASLVSAAIYRREMDRQMNLESLQIDLSLSEPFTRQNRLTDSSLYEIKEKIANTEEVGAFQINLGNGTNWWSTRLYLLAALAADLTDIQTMVFVDANENFVGMMSPAIVKERLSQIHEVLRRYEKSLKVKQTGDIKTEVEHRVNHWDNFMQTVQGEETVKTFVTKKNIKRWFSSYMVERALEWESNDSSTWQMQRLIDYPMRFVPITEKGKFVRVVDRQALTEQIARLFIKEQVSRSRSMTR
jgi:Domain of unknown function (DUF4062)